MTRTATVCPRFSAAFSSALAFAAYIEIIITIVLVFVFKMCALIEEKKGFNGGGKNPVDLNQTANQAMQSADTLYPKLETSMVSAEPHGI